MRVDEQSQVSMGAEARDARVSALYIVVCGVEVWLCIIV